MVFRQARYLNPSSYKDRLGSFATQSYVGSPTFAPAGRSIGHLLPITPPVGSAPTVTLPTGSASAAPGAVITSSGSGTPSPTIQWQYSLFPYTTWTNLNTSYASSVTSPTITMYDQFDSNNYRIRAMYTNSFGSTPSPGYVNVQMSSGGG